MLERITAESWRTERGHVERYELAASLLQPGQVVLDAACGIGYGAQVLAESGWTGTLHAADRPGIHDPQFPGTVHGVDLDTWTPPFRFDVALCFETLEHLQDPQRWAGIITQASLLLVSVPTIPTVGINPYHLHDFTVDSLLDLFPSCRPLQVIPQPHEHSHIYVLQGG
jgi:hypothetical protein